MIGIAAELVAVGVPGLSVLVGVDDVLPEPVRARHPGLGELLLEVVA
jgi:hypothetical protein